MPGNIRFNTACQLRECTEGLTAIIDMRQIIVNSYEYIFTNRFPEDFADTIMLDLNDSSAICFTITTD